MREPVFHFGAPMLILVHLTCPWNTSESIFILFWYYWQQSRCISLFIADLFSNLSAHFPNLHLPVSATCNSEKEQEVVFRFEFCVMIVVCFKDGKRAVIGHCFFLLMLSIKGTNPKCKSRMFFPNLKSHFPKTSNQINVKISLTFLLKLTKWIGSNNLHIK